MNARATTGSAVENRNCSCILFTQESSTSYVVCQTETIKKSTAKHKNNDKKDGVAAIDGDHQGYDYMGHVEGEEDHIVATSNVDRFFERASIDSQKIFRMTTIRMCATCVTLSSFFCPRWSSVVGQAHSH
jgi:hypothetical protein